MKQLSDARQIKLRSTEFRKGRELGWQRLEDMVGRIEKSGIGALAASEIQELPMLYRAAMSSLSVARNIVLDRSLLLYLENLSLRAYLAVYGPRSGITQNLREFLSNGFPGAVRKMRWHLAVAFLMFLAGCAAGYMLVTNDMSYFNMLVPEGLAGGRGPDSSREYLLNHELFAPWPGVVDTFLVFANFLFRHNAIIGIFCFGLGFAFGIPTLMLLIYNGLVMGAFVGLHAQKELTVDFIGWLSIHGVTEILAVMLCAAAGLVVAQHLLFPGRLPRLESLARYGRRAASVAAGAVLLFFIAGFVEGGLRQLISNTPGRYAFAGLSAAFWLYYFACGGKAKSHGRD